MKSIKLFKSVIAMLLVATMCMADVSSIQTLAAVNNNETEASEAIYSDLDTDSDVDFDAASDLEMAYDEALMDEMYVDTFDVSESMDEVRADGKLILSANFVLDENILDICDKDDTDIGINLADDGKSGYLSWEIDKPARTTKISKKIIIYTKPEYTIDRVISSDKRNLFIAFKSAASGQPAEYELTFNYNSKIAASDILGATVDVSTKIAKTDLGLTINKLGDASKIEEIRVDQSNSTLDVTTGTTTIDNCDNLTVSVTTSAGYVPYLYNVTTGEAFSNIGLSSSDGGSRAYVYKYRPNGNVELSVEAKPAVTVRLAATEELKDSLNISPVDFVSWAYAVNWGYNEYGFNTDNTATIDGKNYCVIELEAAKESLYFAAPTNLDSSSPYDVILSYDAEGKNPVAKKRLPSPTDEASDEYKDTVSDFGEMYYVAASADVDIFVTKVYKTKSVSIPAGVTVEYLNAGSNYTVSDDGKTITINGTIDSSNDIKFKVKGDKEYKVKYSYTDEEGAHLANVSYTDSDAGRIYAIDTANFDYIEIVEKKLVTVRFNCQNTRVSVYNEETGEYTGEKSIDVEAGETLKFSVEVTDDEHYVLSYVTPTGKEEDAIFRSEENDLYSITPVEDMTVTAVAVPFPQNLKVFNPCNYEFKFESNKIKIDEDFDLDAYRIPYSVGKVYFSVKVPKTETLDVAVKDNDGNKTVLEAISVAEDTVNTSMNVCSYSFYSDILTEGKDYYNTLMFASAGASKERKLSITYTELGMGSLSLTDIAGRPLTEVKELHTSSDGRTTCVYNVEYGKEYELKLVSATEYNVGNYTITQGSNFEGGRCTKNTLTRSLDIYSDISIDVVPIGEKKIYVYKESESVADAITAKSATQSSCDYYLTKGDSYIFTATSAGEPLKIKSVSPAYALPEITDSVDKIRLDTRDNIANDTIPTIGINMLGKRNTVNVVFEDDSKMRVYLTAIKKVESIKVSGGGLSYTKNGSKNKMSTTIGTDKKVWISVSVDTNAINNSDPDRKWQKLDNLKCVFTADSGNTYTDSKGNAREYIQVVSNVRSGSSSGMYQLIAGDIPDISGKLVLYTDSISNPLVSFDVKTKATDVSGIIPNAKISKSDDVSVSFDIKDNYTIPACVNGKQYYKITAVAKDPSKLQGGQLNNVVEYVPIERPEYPEQSDDCSSEDDAVREKAEAAYEALCDKIDKNFIQSYRLMLNSNGTGDGAAAEYDFNVEFVQTKAGVTADDLKAGNTGYMTGKSVSLTGATLAPLYATKATVKTLKSNVYTNQKDILVARASFEKNVTCRQVTAVDVTDCDDKLDVKVVDDTDIYVSTTKATTVGKHTIEVKPVTGSKTGMHAEATKVTINVIKGINDIKVVPSTTTVLKKPNVAPTVSLSVTYNEGDTAPKTKKVRYVLVDKDGLPINPKKSEPSSSEYDGLIRMSGSKVVIDKMLNVTDGNVSFYVEVYADDYEGNTAFATTPMITVSNDSLVIAKTKLLRYERENRVYKVVATDEEIANLKVSDVDGLVFAAFSDEDSLTEYEARSFADNMIPITDYTLKSSKTNVKVVSDGTFYTLQCSSVANGINLTATTKDGGNKKKVLKLNSVYYKPESLGVKITDDNGTLLTSAIGDDTASFSGNANTKLRLSVMENKEGAYTSLPDLTNYDIKISGGKFVASNKMAGEYSFVVTGSKATITLTDKNKKRTDTGYQKKYTVENKTFVNKKAPVFSVQKTLKSGDVAAQSNTINIKKANGYNPEGKYVMLSLDETAYQAAKTKDAYALFDAACPEIGSMAALPVVKTDNGKYTVGLSFLEENALPAGSYKVCVLIGDMTDGVFVADAKMSTITIKAAKPKAVKGKLVIKNSYKLTKDKESGEYITSVKLTYTGSKITSVSYNGLLNANIKGEPTEFTDYFELTKDAEDNYILRLNTELSDDEKEYILNKTKGANDRIGYITYEALIGDDGYGNPYKVTSVIKIKINV